MSSTERAGLCLQFSVSSAVFLEIFTGAHCFLNTHVHTQPSCFWSILVLVLKLEWTQVTEKIGDQGKQVLEDLRPV